MNGLRIITTQDGSLTLFREDILETYHSLEGAYQEAMHVYINEGLAYAFSQKKDLQILEVGFGTGLNVLLSVDFLSKNPHLSAQLTSLEPFPLSEKIAQKLHYTQFFEQASHFFGLLHACSWEESHQILPNFIFKKHAFPLLQCPNQSFDLIYFDAFAPKKQADIWNDENMDKINQISHSGTVVVSYSANKAFQKKLNQLGFEVEKRKGAAGKKEMTRAIKI